MLVVEEGNTLSRNAAQLKNDAASVVNEIFLGSEELTTPRPSVSNDEITALQASMDLRTAPQSVQSELAEVSFSIRDMLRQQEPSDVIAA